MGPGAACCGWAWRGPGHLRRDRDSDSGLSPPPQEGRLPPLSHQQRRLCTDCPQAMGSGARDAGLRHSIRATLELRGESRFPPPDF